AERTQGRTDPDDAPEPPAHPVAEPADLWVLGGHRLLCGDSTVATDVARVLGGVAPHLMVTDPPYESGLLAIGPPQQRPQYEPTKRRLTWPNGAIATTYSADEPERLRGRNTMRRGVMK